MVLTLNISFDFIRTSAAEMRDGHNMANGQFGQQGSGAEDLFPVIAEKNVDFDIKLNMDNKTGNNISHTTITKRGRDVYRVVAYPGRT
jgi:hypothetical protein